MIYTTSIPANQKQFVLLCFFAALLFHFVAAVLSVGYYYADEQYQIIEFAGYKLGTHAANELAWEFKYQLRSGFLPALCYVLISIFKTIGISNPFNQAIALRFLAAGVSLTAALYLVFTFVNTYKTKLNQRVFIFCALLFWFLPFLDVRFASETFAAALFTILFCKFYNPTPATRVNFAAIALVAMVILIRYQMLLPFAVLVLWNLIFSKNRSQIFIVIAGIAVSFIVGFAVDYFFYGTITIPLFNYSKMIVTGSGPDFGSQPWYFYFNEIVLKSFLPIGIVVLLSFVFYWIKNPKAMLTWVTLSYFLIHCLLPHKELRFLFPMLFFCPIVVAYFIEQIESFLKSKAALHALKIVLLLLGLVNLAIELIVASLPANQGIAIANYLHKNTTVNAVLMHTPYSNPYSPFESIPIKFYSNGNVSTIKIENASYLPDSILNLHSKQFLCLRNVDFEMNKAYLNQKGFDLIYQPINSKLIKTANDFGFEFNDNFVLLER